MDNLGKHIEVEEIFTPLDCIKLANSYHGAFYVGICGWGNSRLPQTTAIENIFLAGAWAQPGPGEVGIMVSGLECFKKSIGILNSK